MALDDICSHSGEICHPQGEKVLYNGHLRTSIDNRHERISASQFGPVEPIRRIDSRFNCTPCEIFEAI